ncbi:hypothetical protein QFZ87_000814 [Bacillus sp. SLBN-46]|nr:hypothetical protein [Bacillus sp. SLBN-46]
MRVGCRHSFYSFLDGKRMMVKIMAFLTKNQGDGSDGFFFCVVSKKPGEPSLGLPTFLAVIYSIQPFH